MLCFSFHDIAHEPLLVPGLSHSLLSLLSLLTNLLTLYRPTTVHEPCLCSALIDRNANIRFVAGSGKKQIGGSADVMSGLEILDNVKIRVGIRVMDRVCVGNGPLKSCKISRENTSSLLIIGHQP